MGLEVEWAAQSPPVLNHLQPLVFLSMLASLGAPQKISDVTVKKRLTFLKIFYPAKSATHMVQNREGTLNQKPHIRAFVATNFAKRHSGMPFRFRCAVPL